MRSQAPVALLTTLVRMVPVGKLNSRVVFHFEFSFVIEFTSTFCLRHLSFDIGCIRSVGIHYKI